MKWNLLLPIITLILLVIIIFAVIARIRILGDNEIEKNENLECVFDEDCCGSQKCDKGKCVQEDILLDDLEECLQERVDFVYDPENAEKCLQRTLVLGTEGGSNIVTEEPPSFQTFSLNWVTDHRQDNRSRGIPHIDNQTSENTTVRTFASPLGGTNAIYNSDGTIFQTLGDGEGGIVLFDQEGFGLWTAFHNTTNDTGVAMSSSDGSIIATVSSDDGSISLTDSAGNQINNISIGRPTTPIFKFDKDGVLIWSAVIENITSVGLHVEIDNSDNSFYVTSQYDSTTTSVNFYNSDGTLGLNMPVPTSISANRDFAIFTKYDSDGNFLWSKFHSSDDTTAPFTEIDDGFDLGVDPSDSSVYYAVGSRITSRSDAPNFVYDSAGASVYPTSPGSNPGILTKFDSNGGFLWGVILNDGIPLGSNPAVFETSGFITAEVDPVTGNVATGGAVINFPTNFAAEILDDVGGTSLYSFTQGTNMGFTSVFDKDGNHLWTAELTTPSTVDFMELRDTVWDEDGNLYSFYYSNQEGYQIKSADGTVFATESFLPFEVGYVVVKYEGTTGRVIGAFSGGSGIGAGSTFARTGNVIEIDSCGNLILGYPVDEDDAIEVYAEDGSKSLLAPTIGVNGQNGKTLSLERIGSNSTIKLPSLFPASSCSQYVISFENRGTLFGNENTPWGKISLEAGGSVTIDTSTFEILSSSGAVVE